MSQQLLTKLSKKNKRRVLIAEENRLIRNKVFQIKYSKCAYRKQMTKKRKI